MADVTVLEKARAILASLGGQWSQVAQQIDAAKQALVDENERLERLAEQLGFGEDWGVRYDAVGER